MRKKKERRGKEKGNENFTKIDIYQLTFSSSLSSEYMALLTVTRSLTVWKGVDISPTC